MAAKPAGRLVTSVPAPNGYCWCDRGGETTEDARFLAGHDKVAESRVIRLHFGSVARFIVQHGYGPEGKDLAEEYAQWQQKNRRRTT